MKLYDVRRHRSFEFAEIGSKLSIIRNKKLRTKWMLENNRYELFESGFGKFPGWTFTVTGLDSFDHEISWESFCKALGFTPTKEKFKSFCN